MLSIVGLCEKTIPCAVLYNPTIGAPGLLSREFQESAFQIMREKQTEILLYEALLSSLNTLALVLS